MNQLAKRAARRPPRRPVDKFAERRAQLAEVALQTLAQLGYARTSLREIAQNSEFSHGVLHYYFADKTELIVHCVRVYKERCVLRFDDVTVDVATPDELVDRFVAALLRTLREDSAQQRLWYDLRVQSLFDETLRADVLAIDHTIETMVWRILSRYAELSGTELVVSSRTAYAIFDGIFAQAVADFVSGGRGVEDELAARVRSLAPVMLAGGAIR